MPRKHTSTNAARKFIRARKKSKARKDNRETLIEQLLTAKALLQTHEQMGNAEECSRLAVRVRTLEQQIRYIGNSYEEILNET